MPRTAREKSRTGIYHVIVRGINRQEIFHDAEDNQRYLEILERITRETGSAVLGYCLMGNHLHLLIQEGHESISVFMKRLGTSYALWYNRKYDRTGHVFQDRFKSESVENDAYLLTVIRYIHQNPVKAGIVERAQDFQWSSCSAYVQGEDPCKLVQTRFILGLFADDRETAKQRFLQFMEEPATDRCLEVGSQTRISDERLGQEIKKILRGKPVSILQQMEKPERDKILRKIKEIEGSSLRQIARITGLTVHTVYKAVNKD
ncbi:MAG: transposase [Firmicutes bacterium]|nr:transposase [Bacillota bacterium]